MRQILKPRGYVWLLVFNLNLTPRAAQVHRGREGLQQGQPHRCPSQKDCPEPQILKEDHVGFCHEAAQ